MTNNSDGAAAPAPAKDTKPADDVGSGQTMDASPATPMGVTAEQKEGRELVMEAYVNVAEVVFNWSKQLEEVQGNAVRAMVNMTGLTHPGHPLHKAGEDGITLFMATAHDGRQRLVFSLKQIQYIQYYIHKLRLAEPAYVEYLGAVEAAGESGEKPVEPPVNDAENVPVPLPGPWWRASEFSAIEPINITSQQALKKMIKDVQKQNKQVEKALLKMQPEVLTPQEKSRAEADEDNNTPGPGLRRAGRREKEGKPERVPREEGTGWGGFPIGAGEEQAAAPIVDIPWKEGEETSTAPAEAGPKAEVLEESKEHLAPPTLDVEDAGSTDGSDAAAPAGDEIANQLNKLNAFAKEMTKSDDRDDDAQDDADDAGQNKADAPMDAAEQYHFDAQQAFVLAVNGGLNAALTARRAAEYAAAGLEVPMAEDGETPEPIVAPEIGRSLFFALDLTTWEEDESVVSEVGWAATWFQEVLVVNEKDEKVDVAGKGEDERPLEQITEHGHIIVQDHLLDKLNGKTKPDNRQAFSFGTSTPHAKKDVMPHLKKQLFDAAARAGGGPVYLLLHSADSDLDELKKLGWRTGGWETELRPDGWEFPSYASEDGIGKVFVIDTARLFGAIENDTSTLPALNKTRKSLEEVAMIMFGDIEDQAPKGCGNAGNDAAYCLKVFTAIITGLPLAALRVEYQASQMPVAAAPIPAGKGNATAGDPSEEDDEPVAATVSVITNNNIAASQTNSYKTTPASSASSTRISTARSTMSSGMTDTSLPKTPPGELEDQKDPRIAAEEDEADFEGFEGDDSEDEGMAIKGVWYTNDAGEDILLSEE